MPEKLNKLKKIKHNIGLSEGGFIGAFVTVDRYLHSLIEQGGFFTIALLPPAEIARAVLYWVRSSDPGFKDGMQKTWLNRAYYTAKAMVTTIGIGIALTGAIPLGFGIVIAGGYMGMLRHSGKTLQYIFEGKADKFERNLQKVLINGLITGGFTLLTFFPSLTLLGWSMVLAATSTVLLTSVPKLLASKVEKPSVPKLLASEIEKPSVPKLLESEIEKPLVIPTFEYTHKQYFLNSSLLASPSYVINNDMTESLIGNQHDRQTGLGSDQGSTNPRGTIKK